MKLSKIEQLFVDWLSEIDSLYKKAIVLWVLIWISIILLWFKYSNLDGLDYRKLLYNSLFFIPIIFGTITLWWNYRLIGIKEESIEQEDKYKTEVNIIEFVERNSNYIILGITALLFASGFLSEKYYSLLKNSNFVFFIGLSLTFSICGVLPLIWMPKQKEPKYLRWLRHFKTIWYTFSIYLFLAGILSMGQIWLFEYVVKK